MGGADTRSRISGIITTIFPLDKLSIVTVYSLIHRLQRESPHDHGLPQRRHRRIECLLSRSRRPQFTGVAAPARISELVAHVSRAHSRARPALSRGGA